MKRRIRGPAFLLAAAVLASPLGAHGAPAEGRHEDLTLGPAGARTAAQAWVGASAGAHPPLIVVLHGDAPFVKPSYQYVFAQHAAATVPQAVVVALLRPGYADRQGRRSDGVRGRTTGDNYTPQVLDQLFRAIGEAKARYGAGEVVVAGHSGGAALSALLLERGVASRALLVSCPCDLGPFRRHMAVKQFSPMWLLPVRSLSPMAGVGRIKPGARVTLVSGTADDIAPPPESRAFAEAARKAGATVVLVPIPGGHEVFLDPAVQVALKALVEG
ncbi:hypothetical protein [Phenylobacterium sp.]|uniref:alpha/beta hydrolase n=1 Tax=Phenylobacterium sp. TaxID=1871053 RepID=UPI0025E89AA6|nr:hypothetical protein [Phenylobacterium sp.]